MKIIKGGIIVLTLILLWGCAGDRTTDNVMVQKEYFPNGNLKLEFETIDSIRNGKFVEYFQDGKIKYKLRYKDGVLEGPGFEYYSNGQVETISVFSGGKVNGEVIFFFEDGNKRSKSKYFNDLIVGKNYEYYRGDDERIKSIKEYVIIGSKSKLIKFVKYDSVGKVIERTPDIEFKVEEDSLQLTIKHKTFDNNRVVLGKYDMFFNLKSDTDTIEANGTDVFKVPYIKGDTVRGYVDNYEAIGVDQTISWQIWFSYPPIW
jgi:hypothetical protein